MSVRQRSTGIMVVLVTCPTMAVARRIAKEVVRARLAACVNLLPGVRSIFLWNRALDECREVLLIIKTTSAHLKTLRRAVLKRHPYQLPEVIALPVIRGHQPYLRWVRRMCQPVV